MQACMKFRFVLLQQLENILFQNRAKNRELGRKQNHGRAYSCYIYIHNTCIKLASLTVIMTKSEDGSAPLANMELTLAYLFGLKGPPVQLPSICRMQCMHHTN